MSNKNSEANGAEITELSWDAVPTRRDRRDAKRVPVGLFEGVVDVIRAGHAPTKTGSRPVITVESDEGWQAWGSNKINARVGDKILLSAVLSPAKDDPRFGFFHKSTMTSSFADGKKL